MSKPAPNCCRASKWLAVVFGVLAAGLLLASLKLPLWQMRMEAPQYRDEEALNVIVYPQAMRGDLQELALLNQYIGVHVPETLPQFQWLPMALFAAAGLGIGALFLPAVVRRYALIAIPAALSLSLIAAAAQAHFQMRDIGHKRDAKVALAGVDNFTPPLLGTRKIAQFEVSSRLGLGGLLAGAAIALQFGAAWASRRRKAKPVSIRSADSLVREFPGVSKICADKAVRAPNSTLS